MTKIACPSEAWEKHQEQEEYAAQEHFWYQLAKNIEEDIYKYSQSERKSFKLGARAMFLTIKRELEIIHDEYNRVRKKSEAEYIYLQDAYYSMHEVIEDLDPDS